jgi:hypothetical protein
MSNRSELWGCDVCGGCDRSRHTLGSVGLQFSGVESDAYMYICIGFF